MEMRIHRAGQLTTVQDLGRRGLRRAGVPVSGAMDSFALRVANALVGNSEGSAALEFTLVGPEIVFARDTIVALGGAECAALPSWKPVRIAAGQTLNFRDCSRGCRGYLAIRGGIDVPEVLGSRSTYLRAAIGGFQGRALRDGDVLRIGDPVVAAIPDGPVEILARPASPSHGDAQVTTWRIDPRVLPAYGAPALIRVLPGAQTAEFGPALFAHEFAVSPQSDRMGIRLTGAKLERRCAEELRSAVVAPGTIQVPADGQPLVLMADAQTIGGYPQVAHVISVDLPVLAQLRSGDRLRFHEVTLEEAHRLAALRERSIALLREGLAEKMAARALP